MKRRYAVRVAAGAAAVFGAAIAYAYSGGPPASRTGAPQELMCDDCHSGYPLNTGGSVSVLDAPPFYRAGSTYPIRVRLESSQTAGMSGRVWGFELTAVRVSDGVGAGIFSNVTGQGTRTLSGSGSFSTRRYIEHSSSGTRAAATSPVEWNVQWTAPNPGVGAVRFHASGLAADGTGDESGDWVYSFNSAMGDSATPAVRTTWGRVKADRR